MSRLVIAIGLLFIGTNSTRADGPADNLPDNVRPIPPKGSPVSSEDAAELRKGLNELAQELAALKSHPLLPDVEIYHTAVRYGLDHNELYVVTDPKTMKVTRNDIATARAHLKTGLRRARELQEGKPSWTKATGLVVRGYRSKIDGSAQPYGLVIPKEYAFDGMQKHRLDFWWHGRYENNLELAFIAERERSPGQFTPPGAIVVHPFGRFSNANKFAGEIDSLEVLEHVKKHYRIDDSRIVARGFSMGGAACWQYAVHYPTLFCAAAPGAGFAETREFLNDFQNEVVKPTWYERKLWRMYDATEYAQNIFNIPTVAYSGEIDRQKQAADVMAREMKKVGLELNHIIGPKTAHSYEKNAKDELNKQIDAIVAKGRDPNPKEIRFTTFTLKYNECAWLRINALQRHWEPARVQATHDGNGAYTIHAQGVTDLTITSPVEVKRVVINETPVNVVRTRGVDQPSGFSIGQPDILRFRMTSSGWQSVTEADAKILASTIRKVHGLQGPIDDAFMDSFLMVKPTGTPMNSMIGQWTEKEMQHAVQHWRQQFRGDARIKADREITDADIQNHNLVLWGDPKSNTILAKIADQLPIREFGDTTVQQLIYPNPLNPKKYVVLNSGFTYREYAYLNNARQVPMLPDYAVVDVSTPPNSRFPGKIVRAGFFDELWKLQPNDGQ